MGTDHLFIHTYIYIDRNVRAEMTSRLVISQAAENCDD